MFTFAENREETIDTKNTKLKESSILFFGKRIFPEKRLCSKNNPPDNMIPTTIREILLIPIRDCVGIIKKDKRPTQTVKIINETFSKVKLLKDCFILILIL